MTRSALVHHLTGRGPPAESGQFARRILFLHRILPRHSHAWGCSGGGLQWAALGSWPNFRHEGRPRQMLYAGLDIHKAVFQAAVLDPDSGELSESRFEPSRERLTDWAMQWQGKLAAVAIEATTGWRWVARELQAHGFEVRLVDPGRASALRGRRRQPKTDRLDARWLALLLARELLSECEAWLPPAEIQRLRDRTRLRKALAGERTGWAQRLHALLAHEGWPCSRGRLLTGEGQRWVAALELDPHVRGQVDVIVAVMAALEQQA